MGTNGLKSQMNQVFSRRFVFFQRAKNPVHGSPRARTLSYKKVNTRFVCEPRGAVGNYGAVIYIMLAQSAGLTFRRVDYSRAGNSAVLLLFHTQITIRAEVFRPDAEGEVHLLPFSFPHFL